jgi:5'-methylthioadenosine phosphorylase
VAEAEIGILGGSGLHDLLPDAERVTMGTPYGQPSAAISVGELGGAPVAFLARQGDNDELPAAQVPNRANVWALKELGVRRIVGVHVCGALRPDFEIGELVVASQFVDRTWGRADTYFDGAERTHVSAAVPFCDDLGGVVVQTAGELDVPARAGGTVVVVQGPRFSTQAESQWFRMLGWDVVNMTVYPESHLAREAALCYAAVLMVTDYDIGIEGAGAVSSVSIARVEAEHVEQLDAVLAAVAPRIGPQPEDQCATALERARARF